MYLVGFLFPAVSFIGAAFVKCNTVLSVCLTVFAASMLGLSTSCWAVNHLDLAPPFAGEFHLFYLFIVLRDLAIFAKQLLQWTPQIHRERGRQTTPEMRHEEESSTVQALNTAKGRWRQQHKTPLVRKWKLAVHGLFHWERQCFSHVNAPFNKWNFRRYTWKTVSPLCFQHRVSFPLFFKTRI